MRKPSFAEVAKSFQSRQTTAGTASAMVKCIDRQKNEGAVTPPKKTPIKSASHAKENPYSSFILKLTLLL
jgi:hypothetical protein